MGVLAMRVSFVGIGILVAAVGCGFGELARLTEGDSATSHPDAGNALDASHAPTVDGGVGPGDDAGGLDSGNDDAGGLDSGNHDASSPSVPTDGLVAYYRGSGIDLSGKGNNATYND